VTPAWRSRDTLVATVGADGTVLARANGTAFVVASAGSIADSAQITVRQLVDTVVVSRTALTLAPGDTATVAATPLDRNRNPIADVAVVFSTASASVATVSTAGRVTAVGSGTTQVRAAAGGHTTTIPVTVSNPGPASIVVTPHTATLASLGELLALTAEVRDGSGAVMAVVPTWTSRAPAIVTVGTDGVVQARANGTAYVVASTAGIADSALVTVRQAVDTILTARDTITLVVGDTATIVVTLLDRNRNPITDVAASFASVDSTVASVSLAGLVRMRGQGSTRITISAGGHTRDVVVIAGQGNTGITAGLAWIRITPGGAPCAWAARCSSPPSWSTRAVRRPRSLRRGRRISRDARR
jgi:hypothetical protein